MVEFLLHFFTPQESNNHRAKLLHHTSVFITIVIFVTALFLTAGIKRTFPQVLGVATNINTSDLLLLTNQKRQDAGLSGLRVNEHLATAALLKSSDMISKNYWAHSAPDGTPPWTFIKNAGYAYVYAGENLARGFNSSFEVVDAWMASKSHKDNIISGDYDEVGFAVVNGTLLGEETTLVVQMFGKQPTARTTSGTVASEKVIAATPIPSPLDKIGVQSGPTPVVFQEITPTEMIPSPAQQERGASIIVSSDTTPLFDSKTLSKNLSLVVLFLFILVFLLDIVIIERKKVVRFIGHSLDHLMYLGAVFILVILLSRGWIL